MILNAYWEPLEFELPPVGNSNSAWRLWIDTSLDSPDDICEWQTSPRISAHTYTAAPHSVVVLWGELADE
jgi:isoamylase